MSPLGCCRGLGYGDREVAKRLCDLVGCIAMSVTGALAEKSDRLLTIKDADFQRNPSQTVPVKVARCGDGGPDAVAFGGEILQVIEILHVVEDEEAVRRIC